MSKGFWIVLGILVLAIAGFWNVGNLYTPNMTDSNSVNSEVVLTDDERQVITLAVASNYNLLGTPEKIDHALQKLQDFSEPTAGQLNAFIVNEYKKSSSKLTELAMSGDYQAQRNLAFGHATDPKIAGAKPSEGCAWYLVLYNSGSREVADDLDGANIDTYCSAKVLSNDQQKAAEIRANSLLKTIYNRDADIKINEYLNSYL
ncbi:hypothetical protein [Psychrobacter sp. AT9]|uniref:hypothetical protein n=1 Tax=Psychrobacter sp. AT9 TaxID=3242893 RepID=UPI0039A67613